MILKFETRRIYTDQDFKRSWGNDTMSFRNESQEEG